MQPHHPHAHPGAQRFAFPPGQEVPGWGPQQCVNPGPVFAFAETSCPYYGDDLSGTSQKLPPSQHQPQLYDGGSMGHYGYSILEGPATPQHSEADYYYDYYAENVHDSPISSSVGIESAIRTEQLPSSDFHQSATTAASWPPSHGSTRDGRGGGRGGGRGSTPHWAKEKTLPTINLNYVTPSCAPPLVVPTDLPVDTTSFLDLVAFYVAQGGPTTEEEFAHRESHNSHFDFLDAQWNDPKLLYYRWRLYSLLQGDTMLTWRTEPFQVEQGDEAFLWIPPPMLESGPECLLAALDLQRRSDHSTSHRLKNLTGTKRERESRESAGVEKAVGEGPKGHSVHGYYPPPTASWLSKMVVAEGRFFAVLSREDADEWRGLLDVRGILERMDQLPALTASTTRDTPVMAAVADGLLRTLFRRELIAERMVFAVEHLRFVHHLLSMVLDEVVKVAYDAAAAWFTAVVATSTPHPITPTEGKELLTCCFMTLWYLFVLHDVFSNTRAGRISEEDLEARYEQEQVASNSFSKSNRSAPPVPQDGAPPSGGSHRLRGVAKEVSRALEKIMPTLIESCCLTAFTCLGRTGALRACTSAGDGASAVVGRGEAAPPPLPSREDSDNHVASSSVPLGLERVIHFTASTAYLVPTAAGASGPPDGDSVSSGKDTCTQLTETAILLLDWVRQLTEWWSPSGGEPQERVVPTAVLSGRVYASLSEKYPFIFGGTRRN